MPRTSQKRTRGPTNQAEVTGSELPAGQGTEEAIAKTVMTEGAMDEEVTEATKVSS